MTDHDSPPPEWPTARLIVERAESEYAVTLERLAVDRGGTAYLISAVGPQAKLKGLRGVLCGAGSKAALRTSGIQVRRPKPDQPDENETRYFSHYDRLRRCDAGYQARFARLGTLGDWWHGLFLAKTPGFLPVITEEGLWRYLKGPDLSTPLLREWMPYVTAKLLEAGRIAHLYGLGCQCGLVRCTSPQLDAIVTDGCRDGAFAFSFHDLAARPRSAQRPTRKAVAHAG